MSDRYQLAYDGVARKRWVVIDTGMLTCDATQTIICHAESGETAETIRRALEAVGPTVSDEVGREWVLGKDLG